jgi:hypothetical protein
MTCHLIAMFTVCQLRRDVEHLWCSIAVFIRHALNLVLMTNNSQHISRAAITEIEQLAPQEYLFSGVYIAQTADSPSQQQHLKAALARWFTVRVFLQFDR